MLGRRAKTKRVSGDHFLEVALLTCPKVMFCPPPPNTVGTTIPRPAFGDRMEVIYISSYTEEEKAKTFALKYLLPKQLKEHGLKRGKT
ncbi:MAG: hypothetical protein ACOX42_02385 [Clostridia bacterium]